MTVEQLVLEKLRALPPEKHKEVLDFVEPLEPANPRPRPLRSLKGLCADLGIGISAAEIDEARREMWANFLREDI